jgi:hypothetical protein
MSTDFIISFQQQKARCKKEHGDEDHHNFGESRRSGGGEWEYDIFKIEWTHL